MAGDWVKIEKDTPEKPEVYRIAEMLGISQGDAFLACFRVWRWVDGQTQDGFLRVSPQAIDDNAKVPNFHHALSDVGWLNVRTGALEIPNFIRHMGMSAKRRCLDSVRKMSAREADKTRTREEKRREEKKKKPPNPLAGGEVLSVPIPDSLDCESFRQALAEWNQHRSEKRKKVGPTAEKRQMAFLSSIGVERAIAAIHYSIRQNWTGIYEEGSTSKPAKNTDLFIGLRDES